MNILIIAHFLQTPSEKGNSRFNYIANILGKDDKLNVELITTNFSHKYKRHRNIENEKIDKLNYKLTMLEEPGYKKNVSLRRFYSHFVFSKNLKKYLQNINEKPDVIYCSVPSLDVAKEAARFAKKENIRFIIDVQDLWPEAFKMVFNIPIISDIIFYPLKNKANYIYKSADDIVAVSKTYVDRACKVNRQAKKKCVVFLGTDLEEFDSFRKENEKNKTNKIKLVYIGTLGHSYDIKCVIDSIEILKNKYEKDVEFIIIGGGPLKEEFEQYNIEKKTDCKFLGRLPYAEMVSKLCLCDIAVNPIKGNSAASIINKVGDYAAAGLPVINTQESEEYRELVEKYDIGFNCENGNSEDIAKRINELIENRELMIIKGNNNRRLAEEKFNRKITYQKIINLIKEEKQ